ncbi:Flagellar biosynthesis protein, FliO [Moorella glycerini]|uniref:Flagellar biosynthesis protein, FliO n=1 Tax=Neomoorella stamsii TaxID=1266720 RepID=A0A9X7P5V9_9FIRM|nr:MULTISPECIES: flagellar biosynthetic protein FliO [Moorella]PRR72279.1 Flagellar biosynthesis protein, FliO [Moorella stamsii]CEP68910.1 Flagellar biosynthesis protein, FliO [Moorella glycerini]CEP69580.1 Flagellar biosynthesis protein, FliO [Moorella glycerini]
MDRDFVLALLRLVIFLPLVLGLAYATVRFGLGRATGRAVGPGQLELVERLPLSSKSGLAVIRCGDRHFLVGLGEGAPVLLAELPDYPAVAATAGEVTVYPLQSLVEKEKEAVTPTGLRGLLTGWLSTWQRFRGHGD